MLIFSLTDLADASFCPCSIVCLSDFLSVFCVPYSTLRSITHSKPIVFSIHVHVRYCKGPCLLSHGLNNIITFRDPRMNLCFASDSIDQNAFESTKSCVRVDVLLLTRFRWAAVDLRCRRVHLRYSCDVSLSRCQRTCRRRCPGW